MLTEIRLIAEYYDASTGKTITSTLIREEFIKNQISYKQAA